MNTLRTPDVGLRLAMMLLDHIIFSMTAGMLVLPFWFFWMYDSIGHLENGQFPTRMFEHMGWLFVPYALVFALYLNKDALDGRSPGKRIIRARVIRRDTGATAGPLRCLARNLTLWLWPVEALLAIVNPDRRRLGDYLAGTQVVTRAEGEPGGPIRWGEAGLSLGIGVAILSAVLLPFLLFFQRISRDLPPFTPNVENRYEQTLSETLEPGIREALGQDAEFRSVRVYERGGASPHWYVEITASTDEFTLDDEELKNELRIRLRAVLEENLTDLPVQGRLRLRAGPRGVHFMI